LKDRILKSRLQEEARREQAPDSTYELTKIAMVISELEIETLTDISESDYVIP
jgi:hypothetical protein